MFSYYKTLEDKKITDNIPVTTLVSLIQDNPLAETITKLHTLEYGSEDYKALKATLPIITPHGTFNGPKKKACLSGLSGYLYFDIDSTSIECDAACYRDRLVNEYPELICMAGKSVGGKGVFFYVNVSNLTPDNFTNAYEYLRLEVFKGLPIDNRAKGLNRVQFIPYDTDVYFNPDISIEIDQDILNEKRDIRYIKPTTPYGYIPNVSFLSMKVLFDTLNFETPVEVKNDTYDIKPVDYVKVFVPDRIKDGNKHNVFAAISNTLIYLNPDASLIAIQSYINWVNENRTTKKMERREMLRTVAGVYNSVRSTGEVIVNTRIKKIHFNKKCGLSGSEKIKIANKEIAKMKVDNSIGKILAAVEEIRATGSKVTQKEVAKVSGLALKTVNRNWDKAFA